MTVYTITLERISTGERAPSMIVRRETEEQARQYVQDIITTGGHLYADIRIAEITARK